MDNALVISVSTEGLTIAAITIIVCCAVKFAIKIIKYLSNS